MSDKKPVAEDFRWISNPEQKGKRLFTFGGQVYSLFRDYPYKLTEDEKRLFDELNPFWADFFKDRK